MKSILISRKIDHARRQKITSIIPHVFDRKFLDATDGHKPEYIDPKYFSIISRKFNGAYNLMSGAVGRFISLYKALEECIEPGESLLVFIR